MLDGIAQCLRIQALERLFSSLLEYWLSGCAILDKFLNLFDFQCIYKMEIMVHTS